MNDAVPTGGQDARREQWEAYIRRTFRLESERRNGLRDPAPPPPTEPCPEPAMTSSRLGIRPGSILAMPMRDESDALPAGFYVLLTDPQLPIVTLCLAGRDSDGYLCATDNRIHIRREMMDLFQPVAGLRLY